jgi:hypothetical protein
VSAWVAVGLGLLAGAATFCMVENALRAPWSSTRQRPCRRQSIGWDCMRAGGHGGPCLPIRSRTGVAWDNLRRVTRRPLERWRTSHDRCPHCGMRETPAGDERGCNCPF